MMVVQIEHLDILGSVSLVAGRHSVPLDVVVQLIVILLAFMGSGLAVWGTMKKAGNEGAEFRLAGVIGFGLFLLFYTGLLAWIVLSA